jgi:L-seryl-tRNA(Ser) seleniumtransferase
MLTADGPALAARSAALADRVGGTVDEGGTLVGGGSAPGAAVPTVIVRVPSADAGEAAARLRAQDPPVIVRVGDGALLIDLRTVDPADDDLLAKRVLDAR